MIEKYISIPKFEVGHVYDNVLWIGRIWIVGKLRKEIHPEEFHYNFATYYIHLLYWRYNRVKERWEGFDECTPETLMIATDGPPMEYLDVTHLIN